MKQRQKKRPTTVPINKSIEAANDGRIHVALAAVLQTDHLAEKQNREKEVLCGLVADEALQAVVLEQYDKDQQQLAGT